MEISVEKTSADQSINDLDHEKLKNILLDATEQLDCENKSIIMFMGLSGAGKSTLVNALLGREMIAKAALEPEKKVLRDKDGKVIKGEDGKRQYEFVYDEQGNQKMKQSLKIIVVDKMTEEAAKDPTVNVNKLKRASIGHSINSKTLTPKIIENDDKSLCLCDCPGFRDNRGGIERVAAALTTELAIQQSAKVSSIVFVTSFKDFLDSRYDSLLKLLPIIDKFVDRSDKKAEEKIFFVVTHAGKSMNKDGVLTVDVNADDIYNLLEKSVEGLKENWGADDTLASRQSVALTEQEKKICSRVEMCEYMMEAADDARLFVANPTDRENIKTLQKTLTRADSFIPKSLLRFPGEDETKDYVSGLLLDMADSIEAHQKLFVTTSDELVLKETSLKTLMREFENYSEQIKQLESKLDNAEKLEQLDLLESNKESLSTEITLFKNMVKHNDNDISSYEKRQKDSQGQKKSALDELEKLRKDRSIVVTAQERHLASKNVSWNAFRGKSRCVRYLYQGGSYSYWEAFDRFRSKSRKKLYQSEKKNGVKENKVLTRKDSKPNLTIVKEDRAKGIIHTKWFMDNNRPTEISIRVYRHANETRKNKASQAIQGKIIRRLSHENLRFKTEISNAKINNEKIKPKILQLEKNKGEIENQINAIEINPNEKISKEVLANTKKELTLRIAAANTQIKDNESKVTSIKEFIENLQLTITSVKEEVVKFNRKGDYKVAEAIFKVFSIDKLDLEGNNKTTLINFKKYLTPNGVKIPGMNFSSSQGTIDKSSPILSKQNDSVRTQNDSNNNNNLMVKK